MYFSNQDIKNDLESRFEEINEATHPEDLLTEAADGYVPVYNGDIIKDWQEMPNEFDDSWQEYGIDGARGIVSLMSYDLYTYYMAQVSEIWATIKAEKAAAE